MKIYTDFYLLIFKIMDTPLSLKPYFCLSKLFGSHVIVF
jgi:hypothetical protein